MTNAEFIRLSEEAGFVRTVFIKYTDDYVLILLLMPYFASSLKKADTSEGCISGYYPVSNNAYRQAKVLAEQLRSQGYNAESNLEIPLKPLLIKSGLGEMGRNSLVSVDGLGSRFHIQTVLTDCTFSAEPLMDLKPALAARCLECERCVRACPTNAIKPGMHIDQNACLRAVSEQTPPPEQFRKLLNNCLLGCDICQDVCPVNSGLPAGTPQIVSLSPLLHGDISQMKQLIGVNYARKKRLRIKAAVAAANLKRADLLSDLTEMSKSSDEDERSIAEWAIKNILENPM